MYHPKGTSWKRKGKLMQDGYLYGPSTRMSFTGDQVAYIYPDFKTVLFGVFSGDTMIDAKLVRIAAHG